MITDTIAHQFSVAKRRGWDYIYVFIDFHEIILVPNWDSTELVHEYYPDAKELLQELTQRKDVKLATWTCSHPIEIEEYLQNFKADGIEFDFVNKNPEVITDSSETPKYGNYDTKPYYNILIDDKAGTLPYELPAIRNEFKKHTLI